MSLSSQAQALRRLLVRARTRRHATVVGDQIIHWEGLEVRVVFKRIKSFRLQVSFPGGAVRLSAPSWVGEEEIRRVLQRKRGWIETQRRRALEVAPRPVLTFCHGEIHQVWGVPHRLHVVEGGRSQAVRHHPAEGVITMAVRTGAKQRARQRLLEAWYREELVRQVGLLLLKWEPIVGRTVAEVRFRQMTSRWGSCHTRDGRIVLNLELARRDRRCLEYVLVHELVHLHERGHNARFYELLARWYPEWRDVHAELNQRPRPASR